MAKTERFMVPGQHEPVSHYCHATRAGDRIWISGTVGIAEDGSIPADTVGQFEVAMQNLDTVLRAAGGAPAARQSVSGKKMGVLAQCAHSVT